MDQTNKISELAPVRTAAPRPEKVEPRAEQRRGAVIEPSPIPRAPAPVVVPAPAGGAVRQHVVSASAAAPVATALPTVQELRQPVLPPPQAQPHYQQQPQYAQPQYAQPQYQQPPYQPPPIVTAQPVVTVPDRRRPVEQAEAEAPNPPQGTLGKIVDTLKPANLFARAREFGEKI